MKRLIIIALLSLIVVVGFGQVPEPPTNQPEPFDSLLAFAKNKAKKKLTQKEVAQKQTIDFSKEIIKFKLSGLIEVDGHVFLNDTCKFPVYYYSNLEEVILQSDDGARYCFRKCEKSGCEIIHLYKRVLSTDHIFKPYSINIEDVKTDWSEYENSIKIDD